MKAAVLILVAATVSIAVVAAQLLVHPHISPQYKLGWIGSDGANYMRYQFKEFTGVKTKKIYVIEPCNLTIKYSISLMRGKLTITLKTMSGETLWSRVVEGDEEGEAVIALGEPGWYIIEVSGEHAEGYFDITWIG